MTEACKITVERRGDIAILFTDGYINNQGGEEIARQAYAQLDAGARGLVLDLEKTRIVNSIDRSSTSARLLPIAGNAGATMVCSSAERNIARIMPARMLCTTARSGPRVRSWGSVCAVILADDKSEEDVTCFSQLSDRSSLRSFGGS